MSDNTVEKDIHERLGDFNADLAEVCRKHGFCYRREDRLFVVETLTYQNLLQLAMADSTALSRGFSSDAEWRASDDYLAWKKECRDYYMRMRGIDPDA